MTIHEFDLGWSIYAMWLGNWMGMYNRPEHAFGWLALLLNEACLLTIDTGIHGLGWGRDRAIAFMRENAVLPGIEVERYVDFTITAPGLASAGIPNFLRPRQMRDHAASTLGARFDERAFHDAVICDGNLPMDLVEDRVARWIESMLAASDAKAAGNADRGP